MYMADQGLREEALWGPEVDTGRWRPLISQEGSYISQSYALI